MSRWLEIYRKEYSCLTGLIYLLGLFPEFRNLFYYRIGKWKYLLNILCPRVSSLVIDTKSIGGGLIIYHGFATTIGAQSIGKNCSISQQVTIGDYNGAKPIIMDNVTIHTGAVIIGGITIGSNTTIGANTIVFSDIPDNSTVFSEPSKYIRWKK